jgi:hypothetical protein
MEAKGGRPGSRRPYVSFEVPATITVDAMTTSDSERAPQADWLMLGDAVDDLLAGLGDADGFRAAFGALRQAASSIDHQALLNTPQLPGDAGEYRRRLAVMLARIPDATQRGALMTIAHRVPQDAADRQRGRPRRLRDLGVWSALGSVTAPNKGTVVSSVAACWIGQGGRRSSVSWAPS